MKLFGYSLAEIRKFLVGAIGIAVTVLTFVTTDLAGFIPLPDGSTNWIASAVAILTAIGIFLVKNGDKIDDLSDGRLDGKIG